jgi:hypothetical protein
MENNCPVVACDMLVTVAGRFSCWQLKAQGKSYAFEGCTLHL